MKLNINKLQQGGRVYFSAVANPYSNEAIQDQYQEKTTKGATSGKEKGLISDSMLKSLVENALPNEFQKFLTLMIKAENSSEKGDFNNRQDYYNMLQYANQMIQQKDYVEKVEKQSFDNDSYNEIAVNNRGYIYVTDGKKIETVHVSKYDHEKHQALTIGDLINVRKFSPNGIDDSEMINTIGNSVGLSKINDFIRGILEKLGNSDNKVEAYQNLQDILGNYAKQPSERQLKTIQGLLSVSNQLGPDAIFKTSEEYNSKDLESALQYIMGMLPRNMRNQLEADYVVSGGKYEDAGKYTINLIKTALDANNNVKYNYEIDYDKTLNKDSDKKQSSEKTHNQTMLELFFNGDLNRSTITISDTNYKNKYAMQVQGTIIPKLTTDDNKTVDNTPLSIALSGKGMGKYLDYSKTWMGYDKISEGMLNNILYTNDEVGNVWMPVDSEGNIDWNAMHSYSKSEDEIKYKEVQLGRSLTPDEKNQIHAKNRSVIQYDSNGNPTKNQNVAQFLMTHGFTIDDHVESSNTLTRELTGSEETNMRKFIKDIYKNLKKVGNVGKMQGWGWLTNTGILPDDIVQVPIFIKIRDNAAINAAHYADQGSLVKNNTLQDDMLIQQQQQSNLNFTASSQDLYN